MTKLNIFIENAYNEYNIDEVLIYNKVKIMADFIFQDKSLISKSCIFNYDFETVSFDIVFVNNNEIQRINNEYRQKNSPTDVISFAMFADCIEDERYIIDGDINLGEIIISLDRIESQAKENNVEFYDELYYIISHGILHLLGFDHQNEQDYNFMIEYQNNAKAMVKCQNINHQ